MMCLNETTVCKPLNYREHFFYKSLPPDIMQFTPQFKGMKFALVLCNAFLLIPLKCCKIHNATH